MTSQNVCYNVHVCAVYATAENKIKWKATIAEIDSDSTHNNAPTISEIDFSEFSFERTASSNGTLFGSVTSLDIRNALAAQGVAVSEISIESLKIVGTHKVLVDGKEVLVTIKSTVT